MEELPSSVSVKPVLTKRGNGNLSVAYHSKDGDPLLPRTTGANSQTAGMSLKGPSVLAEISIVYDSVRQLKPEFLQLNFFQFGQLDFGVCLLFDA